MKKQWLSMILAMCLLISALPFQALSEAVALPIEAGEEAVSEPGEELPVELGEVELSGAEADEAAWAPGYAWVIEEGASVCGDGGELVAERLPVGAVVYAYDLGDDGRVAVCWDSGSAVMAGWMDATALIALSMDDTAAFLAGEAAREEPRYFDREGTILLPLIPDEMEAQPLAAGQYALELSAASLDLTVGDTAELKVTTADAGAIAWTSSDEAVAAVTEAGVVTAVAPGEAEITAVAENGDKGVCAVTVTEGTEEVRYNQFSLSMGVGERVRDLKVVKGDGSLYEGEVTYDSSDRDIVAISSKGGMRGVKKGTAQITAATGDGTAVCAVTVGTAPKKLTLSRSAAELGIGMTLTLETKLNSGAACHNYTYTSSNGKVASVSDDGTVTALAAGKAKITVKTFNDISATCKVTVVAVPDRVSLAQPELLVAVDQKASIEAEALDVNGEPTRTTFTYAIDDTSADPGCIELDSATGEVRGLSKGSAAVKVAAHNGVEAVCQVRVVEAPTEVRLPESIEVGVKETVGPVAVELIAPEGEDACAAKLTWSSDNRKIAKVNADTGAITGVKAGATTIHVKTHNGRECAMDVVVRKAPSKVTARPSALTLGVGEKVKLGYKLPSGSVGKVTFTSAKPDILSVDKATGEAEALAPGKAKVTIKTYNDKKAAVTVTVMAAPTSISLSNDQLCLGLGETVKLGVALDEGAGGTIFYESGDNGVASVSNGSVTGVSLGDTRVVVSTYNGLEAACDVTVKPAPTSVSLPCKKLTLGVGETEQLEPDLGGGASALTYESGNAKIAKVTAKGVIKGVKAGSANITVKTFNGQSASVKVTVKAAPSKVTLTETDRHLGVGESFYIGWKIPAGSGGTVTMESTDPSVVSLDADGLAVGRAVGTAEIVARAYNGKEARCKVTVHNAPTSVDLGGEVIEIGVGQSMKLKPAFPGDGWSALKYAIDDTSVAKVSADGTVKALKAGTATLTAATYLPGVTGKATIRSIGAPDKVSLEKTSMEMNVDETYQLVPIIPENTMAGFTYKSSKPAVAEVDANGLIRTKQRGKTTIIVTTHNGKTAKLALTVYDPWYPEKLVLDTPPKLLDMGETYQATYTVTPADARAGLVWTSSNEKILSVDQNGLVTAREFGYATITVTSERNAKLSAKFRIGVRNGRLTLDIPLRQTDIAGIPDNLAMIENIRLSAISEVDRLFDEGTITQADADRRKRIINKAFQQYAFPWMTPKFQIYWNTANSQGGVKDFKPGIVYYGLPYISGLGANRNYTAARALEEKRYTDSGSGYYLLNQKKYVNGKYCGTDCSGNVAVSIWGTRSSRTADRTDDIASNPAYKSSNFKSMRPGDIIVRSGGHALFFMYYCSVDKDYIMIMEQGGNEFGINTVHCSVFPVSYFTKRGYIVRRLATLG